MKNASKLRELNPKTTYLKMNNCSGHCSCYTDWGEQGSKVLLAVAGRAVLGSVARTATDAEGVAEDVADAESGPEDLRGGEMGNETALGIVQAAIDEGTQGVVDGADAEQLQALGGVDVAGGGLAVANPVPSGGDAGRRTQVSIELCSDTW
jgi:hypothetical protein